MTNPETKDVSRVLGFSSSWSRFPASTLKLTVEIFDGTGDFDMWQREVLDSLLEQGFDVVIISS